MFSASAPDEVGLELDEGSLADEARLAELYVRPKGCVSKARVADRERQDTHEIAEVAAELADVAAEDAADEAESVAPVVADESSPPAEDEPAAEDEPPEEAPMHSVELPAWMSTPVREQARLVSTMQR